jgi:hypothetical protein
MILVSVVDVMRMPGGLIASLSGADSTLKADS